MAKEVWGAKRVCQNLGCGARFYDLMRNPILCPKCGTEFVVDTPNTSRDEEFEPADEEARTTKKAPDTLEDEDDILSSDSEGVDLDDDVLDESDEDTVPLDDIANVSADEDDV